MICGLMFHCAINIDVSLVWKCTTYSVNCPLSTWMYLVHWDVCGKNIISTKINFHAIGDNDNKRIVPTYITSFQFKNIKQS